MSSKDRQQRDSAQRKAVAKDLLTQLEAGKAAQADRLTQALNHLVGQLKMAKVKYRTVNGYMQARETLLKVGFDEATDNVGIVASEIASGMSDLAGALADKVKAIGPTLIDEDILDGYLDESFVDKDFGAKDVAEQLLIANLLQNVGPVLNDLVSFRTGTNEEIAKLSAELAKLDVTPGQLTVIEGGEQSSQEAN